MDKRGVTQSGIPSSDKRRLPIIPLSNVQNFIKITPTFYYENYLKSETSNILQQKKTAEVSITR